MAPTQASATGAAWPRPSLSEHGMVRPRNKAVRAAFTFPFMNGRPSRASGHKGVDGLSLAAYGMQALYASHESSRSEASKARWAHWGSQHYTRPW